MATLRYSIPGVGGSLGACAVCGDTFLHEILMGKNVDMLGINGIDKDLPVHTKCAEQVRNLQGPWAEIRDKFPKGPMYDCFEEAFAAKKTE
jgi:hypothetical protein